MHDNFTLQNKLTTLLEENKILKEENKILKEENDKLKILKEENTVLEKKIKNYNKKFLEIRMTNANNKNKN